MGVTWKLPLREIKQAVGNVAFRKPALRRLGAVDHHVKLGIVGLLLDAQIGNPADMPQFVSILSATAGIARRYPHRRSEYRWAPEDQS